MSVSRKSRLIRSQTPYLPDLDLPSCKSLTRAKNHAFTKRSRLGSQEKQKDRSASMQADLFTAPLPARLRQHLNAQDVRLAYVPHGALKQPHPNALHWLYHVTTPDKATSYFDHGITLSRKDPLLLTEAAGISAWLGMLHSDSQHMLRHNQFCVLRLYRKMVIELLEADADQTTQFQAPCYWLTTAPPV